MDKINELSWLEYQQLCQRTLPDLGTKTLNVEHMVLGIITECGEALDIFKKKIAYKKPVELAHLGEELGDICWYICNLNTLNGNKLHVTTIDYLKNTVKPYAEMTSVDFTCVGLLKTLSSNYSVANTRMNEEQALFIVYKISQLMGINIHEYLYKNIEKLKARYPDKYDDAKALNRDLDTENKILGKK